MQHDFAVFIGRFQPFHNGHKAVVDRALEAAEKVVILPGSARQPRSLRNPLNSAERESMIRAAYPDESREGRLLFAPLLDITYNENLWISQVQKAVWGLTGTGGGSRITLIGRGSRKGTGYYPSLFPRWDSLAVPEVPGVNGSAIRSRLFKGETVANMAAIMPPAVVAALDSFMETPAGKDLLDDQAFVDSYRKGWEQAPYPPTFVTADCIVVQSGHVLLVERGARPGKGLWALPGGFLNLNETLLDGAVRELKEETKIKVPTPVLKGSVRAHDAFDEPYRSARGRTITHVFHIDLRPGAELPEVKGGDDAKDAFWLPLARLDPERMFEDHYFIIQKMLGMM